MGGGGGGVMTGRQAANALSKLTWILAAGFLTTSLTLTIIASRNATGASVLDQLGVSAPASTSEGDAPALPTYTPPPGVGQPIAPPAPDAGAATPAPTAAAPVAPAADAAPAASEGAATAPATPPAAN